MRLDVFDLTQFFNGLPVHQVTSDSIYGISRVNNDTSTQQGLSYMIDFSAFRILRMYLDKFSSHTSKVRESSAMILNPAG